MLFYRSVKSEAIINDERYYGWSKFKLFSANEGAKIALKLNTVNFDQPAVNYSLPKVPFGIVACAFTLS